MGSNPEIIKEAFDLAPGQISRLVKSGDTHALMKLIDKTDARIPSYEEVAAKARSDYLEHLAVRAAENKAEKIIEELRKNPNDVESIAKKYKLTWQDIDPVSTVAGFVPKLGDFT